MIARDFQVFTIRYVGDVTSGKSMDIAICVNEIGDGDNRFLGFENTEEWEKLSALFPDADIEFLKEWCDAIRKEFCSPNTSNAAQESLKNCSTNIDVSVSRISLNLTDVPGAEMKKWFPMDLRL